MKKIKKVTDEFGLNNDTVLTSSGTSESMSNYDSVYGHPADMGIAWANMVELVKMLTERIEKLEESEKSLLKRVQKAVLIRQELVEKHSSNDENHKK